MQTINIHVSMVTAVNCACSLNVTRPFSDTIAKPDNQDSNCTPTVQLLHVYTHTALYIERTSVLAEPGRRLHTASRACSTSVSVALASTCLSRNVTTSLQRSHSPVETCFSCTIIHEIKRVEYYSVAQDRVISPDKLYYRCTYILENNYDKVCNLYTVHVMC